MFQACAVASENSNICAKMIFDRFYTILFKLHQLRMRHMRRNILRSVIKVKKSSLV